MHVVLTCLLLEGIFYASLSFPNLLPYFPEGFGALIRKIYFSSDRMLVQYQKDCAHYDPLVSYRLTPGSCLFQNREFKTRIEVNSAGLRDDENSLRAPEIIVLGDSYAMGHGVNQMEAFPALLETLLNK